MSFNDFFWGYLIMVALTLIAEVLVPHRRGMAWLGITNKKPEDTWLYVFTFLLLFDLPFGWVHALYWAYQWRTGRWKE